MQRSVETYGLPLGLILLGYGSLVSGSGSGIGVGALRLLLHFMNAILVARVGQRIGLNRTASLLAGLFFAGSPLAAFALGKGSSPVPQIWACMVLGSLLVWPRFRAVGWLGSAVRAVTVFAGTVGLLLLVDPGQGSGFAFFSIPGDLLSYGSWLVLPVPLVGNSSLWVILVFGGGLWVFWILMAVHRFLLGNWWPFNLLVMTGASLLPCLGRTVDPGLLLLPLALFALFLMTFLRPAKLVDSPRILLMAAFFLTLLAFSTSMLMGV